MGSVPYFVWWISVQVFVFWETLSGALSNGIQQHNQIQLLNFINNKINHTMLNYSKNDIEIDFNRQSTS